jgi:ADP-heptose:LPS heptosyltransferase
MDRAAAWTRARRIICVRLDGMGDVLMTTPAIRALAASGDPGRRITMLASSGGAALGDLIDGVDDVIAYDAPWVKGGGADGPAGDRRMVAKLRERAFDAAVIFTVCTQSALPAATLCYMAGIPLRLAHSRENAYRLLTDWIPEPERDGPQRHEVRRQLDLVAAVGATTADESLSVRVPRRGFDEAIVRLADAGWRAAPSEPFLVLHVGASAPSRRYRADGFAEAARELARRGHLLVFTGSADEAELVDSVRRRVDGRTVSLAGRLSIEGLAAVLSMATVVVSNNTAPVHLSAAVGTPVVDLYALTNLQHTPWMVPNRVLFHDVPCKGCLKSVCPLRHHACLALVSPSDVVRAALHLAERSDSGSAASAASRDLRPAEARPA